MKVATTFLGQEIPEIDEPGLRQFGLIFAGIVCTLFGLALPFFFDFDYPLWPWIVAGLFTLIALTIPRFLGAFYRLWMRFGVVMNIIMSRLILGTVFVLTVIPAGLIFRIRGKDILRINIDSEAVSYRDEVEKDQTNDLKKPY